MGLAAILMGLPAGWALARLTSELSGRGPASPRRILGFVGAAAALAGWAQWAHPGAPGVLGALLAWQLLLLAALDAEDFWLPAPGTLGLIATGLLAAAVEGPAAALASAIGAAAGWAGLAGLAFIYRRLRGHDGLGGGDAFLLAGGGAWIGWIALPTALVWSAAAGLAAVGVLAVAGRPVARTQPLPFGVALAVGIWLAWLYGPIGRA